MGQDHDHDGHLNRRDLLGRCAGWAGTAAVYSVASGVVSSVGLDAALAAGRPAAKAKPFTFVQISDTHIGFDKPANPNVHATALQAVERIKAMAVKPDLIGQFRKVAGDEWRLDFTFVLARARKDQPR